MTVHDFQRSLALSESYHDAPWWLDVYRTAFPSLQSMASIKADGWAQRGGIDRVLTLASGKTLSVDEKVRSEEWNDILLEYWSDRDRKVRGWVAKDLACDYIAYAFVQSQRCYLLPFQALRRAWISHGRDWVSAADTFGSGFRIVEAKNNSYVTVSVAVPIPALLEAIKDALIVTWGAT